MIRRRPILRAAAHRLILLTSLGLLPIVPAHAADAFVLPDPSGVTLFALGIAGVLIGRAVSNKRKD